MAIRDTISDVRDYLADPRRRWGMAWRLAALPVTLPLMYGGMLMVGLASLIAHGKWRTCR